VKVIQAADFRSALGAAVENHPEEPAKKTQGMQPSLKGMMNPSPFLKK